jgi:hypothetical protein
VIFAGLLFAGLLFAEPGHFPIDTPEKLISYAQSSAGAFAAGSSVEGVWQRSGPADRAIALLLTSASLGYCSCPRISLRSYFDSCVG